jgi:NADPH2 dehydrogenase
MSMLFSSYSVKNITLKNRIVMSPMCMYSCFKEDGKVTDWHKIHYSSRAVGQVGLIIIEASAVTPQGRISKNDLGIWDNKHISGLKELIDLIHEQGAKAAIQLAHAGRKAILDGPIIAPSAIPFKEDMKTPEEMSLTQIKETIYAFREGARRAKEAGFDIIEIHAAHGYLINEFLSPLTNHRQDEYGGDRDQRYRFLMDVIHEVKKEWEGPLFVRISASEYHPVGNQMDDILYYASKMKEQGVDLIDCSSGGTIPVSIDTYPGYQVSFADQIKNKLGIPTGSVGLITKGIQAEEILKNNRADLIFIGRELLRDPYWARSAAKELSTSLPSPTQYERGWGRD